MFYFDLIVMIVGWTWLLSTLAFIRVSAKRIETKILQDGHDPIGWDRNGWGIRFPMYASVLMRGKPAKVSLVEDKLILKYATVFDRVLAYIVTISFVMALALGAVMGLGPEEYRVKTS